MDPDEVDRQIAGGSAARLGPAPKDALWKLRVVVVFETAIFLVVALFTGSVRKVLRDARHYWHHGYPPPGD